MANKSTISSLLTKLKRRVDYNITDTDLDNMLVDFINDALKLVAGWLIQNSNYQDTLAINSSVSTVASQQYVDISSTLAQYDDIIGLYERSNDKFIPQIPLTEFLKLYPDPDAEKSAYPDYCSVADEKIYLGPTPTGIVSLYVLQSNIPLEITSSGNCPFKTKYDPLILACCRVSFLMWHDANNISAIESAKLERDYLKKELISNFRPRQERGLPSRRGAIMFGPKKAV